MPDSKKEKKLKEMENRLAEKYTPSIFRDSLEGRTINMEPVDIVIDQSVPESKYPKTVTVSRKVTINYRKATYELIQKDFREGVIAPVDVPTKFCARATFAPKLDRVSLRQVTDFRGLNRIIQRPVCPFNSTESIIKAVEPKKQRKASMTCSWVITRFLYQMKPAISPVL